MLCAGGNGKRNKLGREEGEKKKNVEKENEGVITVSRVHSPFLVLACRGRDAPDTLLLVGRQKLENRNSPTKLHLTMS